MQVEGVNEHGHKLFSWWMFFSWYPKALIINYVLGEVQTKNQMYECTVEALYCNRNNNFPLHIATCQSYIGWHSPKSYMETLFQH